MQSKEQKNDIASVYQIYKKTKKVDYIACWFLKAASFIEGVNGEYAFVSTNSICQGEQVLLLWPHIFSHGLEISFAYQSFKWQNNAKGNAGVTCVIVGVRNKKDTPKYIFKEGLKIKVKNVSPYLTDSKNLYISRRTKPISELPEMDYGNMAIDGGFLILSPEEKNDLIFKNPEAKPLIRKIYGAQEFIKGVDRWCLWIEDDNLLLAQSIPEIAQRIDRCRSFRESSTDKGTHKLAAKPHQFREMKCGATSAMIVPTVTSERREYIPVGFLGKKDVIIAPNNAVYDPEPFVLGVVTSKMHVAWVKATAGKLESRIRYSNAICYNTFPIPSISDGKKKEISNIVFELIGEREKYSDMTVAELYDPKSMPQGLREVHGRLDKAVESCYSNQIFKDDEHRLEVLFSLYEKMTGGQNA